MKKIFSNFLKKSAQRNNLMAFGQIGKPVFTCRRYDSLADEGYEKNVIVYRCITLIARGLASIPWLLYNQDHEIEKHPLIELLNCPSPRQAGSAFMECLVSQLLLSGNAYIEAVYDEFDNVVELYPLRPDRINVVPGIYGLPSAYEYKVNGKTRTYLVDNRTNKSPILHIKLFHPLNDWYGLSPLEAAATSVDQHNAVSGHNLALLQNGGRPSGALIIKPNSNAMPLSENQRNILRDDIKKLYEGSSNAGKIMVMEGDFSWQEMGLSPKDLDFISGKSISSREICQAFGVPPILAGIPGDATFANYKEARLHLWEDTILPLLDYIIAEFNLWLTPLFGKDLKLNYDHDNIPALAIKRESAWEKIANASFLTINEKRQAVGYSPIAGGDIF